MFRSTWEAAQKAWSFFEPFTLLSIYEALQKQVVDVYSSYQYTVERYSKEVQREVSPVTEDYLEEHPEIAEQNVALLKNAMELWKAASQTSDAVAPMLYHYSWHCFNSFFVYTFFRWNPQHAKSHGIRIPPETLGEDIEDIKIQIHKEKDKTTRGLFQRLIDTWTLLGTFLAFSSFFPVFEGNQIKFVANDRYLVSKSNTFSLKHLLTFNPVDHERKIWKIHGKEGLLQNASFSNSMSAPTRIVKSYLIVFVASSMARYRPILWNSVLIGANPIQSNFALNSRRALVEYTSGAIITTGFLYQVSRLFADILKGKFELRKMP